jgi:hypothetical protein
MPGWQVNPPPPEKPAVFAVQLISALSAAP